MGQPPNIELSDGARPRAELQPAAARGWKPARPAEIGSPDQAVSGGAFGRPGPDTGWVLRIIRQTEFERGRQPEDLEAIVATVAAARASHFGRGPTVEDVEVALILLGLRPAGIPDQVLAGLTEGRERSLRQAAHERVKGRALLSTFSPAMLTSSPDHLRHLLNVAAMAAKSDA